MQKSARLTEEDLHKAGYTVVGNEALPLGDARPDPAWDEDRLALYAKGELANSQEAEQQALLQSRKSAVHLFRAGHALALARAKCKGEQHGAWTEFKERHRLAHTTANDAIRLYESAKTEDALAGLGITEAKEKFVYQAKAATGEEGPQDQARRPKKPRSGGRHEGGQVRGGKVRGQGSGSPEAAAGSTGDHHAAADQDAEQPPGPLAEELKEMAQRLSEIALNEWGKVDWSVEDVGDVELAVRAINTAIARLVYKVKNEAKHS
jgi:hypothetical protein